MGSFSPGVAARARLRSGVSGKDRERGRMETLGDAYRLRLPGVTWRSVYLASSSLSGTRPNREINGRGTPRPKAGVPLVATGDVHYPKRGHIVAHLLLTGNRPRERRLWRSRSRDGRGDVKLTFYDDAERRRDGRRGLFLGRAGRGGHRLHWCNRVSGAGRASEGRAVPVSGRRSQGGDQAGGSARGWRYRGISSRPDAARYADRGTRWRSSRTRGFVTTFLPGLRRGGPPRT